MQGGFPGLPGPTYYMKVYMSSKVVLVPLQPTTFSGKSAFCYRIWCLLLSNTIVSMCIVSVFCMYFCPYPAIFLRIRRIHRIHVSDAYPTCIRCIHLYPPSRQKYARICPRIRTVDSHSVGRKRGFVSIFVFFAEYIVNTRCIHTYLDVFRRNIRE